MGVNKDTGGRRRNAIGQVKQSQSSGSPDRQSRRAIEVRSFAAGLQCRGEKSVCKIKHWMEEERLQEDIYLNKSGWSTSLFTVYHAMLFCGSKLLYVD
jgi:hypothetical protein